MATHSPVRYDEYRVVVIHPASGDVLAIRLDGAWRIPRLMIPHGARPTLYIQAALQNMWGVSVFVIDFLSIQTTDGACVLAELLREPHPIVWLRSEQTSLILRSSVRRSEHVYGASSLAKLPVQ